MRRPAHPTRAQRWYPRLHRWLGLGSLVFVLLLSVTGIALNHSTALVLNERYVRADWILRLYGISAPTPTTGFMVDGHDVALVGARLYFDEREIADGITELVGAVATGSYVVVATRSEILLLASDGTLVEQLDAAFMLPAGILALGVDEQGLLARTAAGIYRADEDLLSFVPWRSTDTNRVRWAIPRALDAEQITTLGELYRGRGLSVERLLLDLHSGRVFARVGPWLMDLGGIALIALSLLGLGLWLQRRPLRQPESTAGLGAAGRDDPE